MTLWVKTPLMVCAISNDVDTIKKLLNFGCDPNTMIHDFTALSCACCYNSLEAVKILLPITNTYKNTIQAACINDISNVINIFFDYIGYDQYNFNKNYYFFESCFIKCCSKGVMKNYESFLENIFKRNIKIPQNFYGNALIESIKFDKIEIVKNLLTSKNINFQDKNGNTPLMISVLFKSKKCLKFLHDLSDLRIRNNDGKNIFSIILEIGIEDDFMKHVPEELSILSISESIKKIKV